VGMLARIASLNRTLQWATAVAVGTFVSTSRDRIFAFQAYLSSSCRSIERSERRPCLRVCRKERVVGRRRGSIFKFAYHFHKFLSGVRETSASMEAA